MILQSLRSRAMFHLAERTIFTARSRLRASAPVAALGVRTACGDLPNCWITLSAHARITATDSLAHIQRLQADEERRPRGYICMHSCQRRQDALEGACPIAAAQKRVVHARVEGEARRCIRAVV